MVKPTTQYLGSWKQKNFRELKSSKKFESLKASLSNWTLNQSISCRSQFVRVPKRLTRLKYQNHLYMSTWCLTLYLQIHHSHIPKATYFFVSCNDRDHLNFLHPSFFFLLLSFFLSPLEWQDFTEFLIFWLCSCFFLDLFISRKHARWKLNRRRDVVTIAVDCKAWSSKI